MTVFLCLCSACAAWMLSRRHYEQIWSRQVLEAANQLCEPLYGVGRELRESRHPRQDGYPRLRRTTSMTERIQELHRRPGFVLRPPMQRWRVGPAKFTRIELHG